MLPRLYPRIVYDTPNIAGIQVKIWALKIDFELTFLCEHHWAPIHQQVDPIGIPQQFHFGSTDTVGLG